MITFKSPFSSRVHVMQEYDDDYILDNSKTQEKRITDFNNTVLTQKNWNMNKYSTRKKDTYNDLTLSKGQVNTLHNRLKKTRYPRKNYNW